MNATRKTICLSMIVKNEAPVIRRCLDSVRSLIDAWVIVDTGSTDGTQDIIREVLADLPGGLLERPWVDFAHNRSEALTLARDRADYSLIIDADDTIEIPVNFELPDLIADDYSIEIRDSSTQYRRTQLVRNTLPWRYEGVLHEFLTCEGAQPGAMLEGVFMRRNHDGARRRDPSTYQRDAQILEAALAGEVSDFLRSRYTFYLAQSYRDFGEKEKALQRYLERAELGFWDQERFISLYQAAQLKADLGHLDREVIDTYLRATEVCPVRAEALHGASRHCRNKGLNEEGFQLAKRGLAIAKPENGLFVEPWIYQHGLLDELAVNGYWSGHYRESLDAGLRLLSDENCAPDQRGRFVANAQAALQKLPRDPSLGTYGTEGLIEQHALVTPRQLHSRINGSPRVFVAILAKQKESVLPLYLECIESLDYPKSSIVIYIRTNNNIDATEQILRAWVARVGPLYASIEFDSANVEARVEQFGVHEWNATRFRVLGHIRNVSLRRALEQKCDFYFVADVDNFVRPSTLRELIALDVPIVSPLLRSIAAGAFYSNYHAEVDNNGYYKESDQYHWILSRWIRGVLEVPVVHCTYLIRADVLLKLTYQDATDRHEYVVFSDSARRSGIPQYMDNRQIYGYITFGEGDSQFSPEGIQEARKLLEDDLRAVRLKTQTDFTPVTASTMLQGDRKVKTLVFCTSFAKTKEEWNGRYWRWTQALKQSELNYDQMLIVDDGSPVMPDWNHLQILIDGDKSWNSSKSDISNSNMLLYHFKDNLGRKAVFDFPGWYRSFAFAGRYAHSQGYERVVHVESDSFLIGSRVPSFFNKVSEGWVALWCPLYQGYPESAVQVIAGKAIARLADLEQTHPHSSLIGREFELQLPIDLAEKQFIGNRYGEYLPFVPGNAEYAVQVRDGLPPSYYWWLSEPAARA